MPNKTEVEIGQRVEGKVEILSGINEGDQIIAEGLKKLDQKEKLNQLKIKCS